MGDGDECSDPQLMWGSRHIHIESRASLMHRNMALLNMNILKGQNDLKKQQEGKTEKVSVLIM